MNSPSPKNEIKGHSYRVAFARIKSANEEGYYLETVTLCESIICDRLLSYVVFHQPHPKSDVRTPFAELIKRWRKLTGSTLPVTNGKDLGERVDYWRKSRNKIVHNFAKSMPTTPTIEVSEALKDAKSTAIEGAKLAHEVSSWHRRQASASPDRKRPLRSRLS